MRVQWPNEKEVEALWSRVEGKGLSRRRFLTLLGIGGTAAVLGGCTNEDGTTTTGGATTTAGPTTTAGAAAPASGIVKPVPERFFIAHGSTNAETRFEVMADQEYLTPNSLFFVRSHESAPRIDAGSWTLKIEGDGVDEPLELTYDELLALPSVTVTRYLECAGNGRSFYKSMMNQEAQGSQWLLGAYGIAEWTGVTFREVLERAKVKNGAVDVMPVGLDPPNVRRPMSIEKALQEDTILAYAMNGDLLPTDHGFPVRALVPGWVGVNSVKWVGSIEVSTAPLFSKWNTESYVLIGPDYQPQGDQQGPPVNEQVLKSAICLPFPATLPPGRQEIVGYAWSPHGTISKVEVSLDDGKTYQAATLQGPNLPAAGTRWTFAFDAREGEMTITPRATDERGNTQPALSQQKWNQLGYLFGAMVPHPVNVTRTTTTTARAATTTTAAGAATATTAAGGAAQGTAASELARAGRQIYEQNCSSCHGDQGQGTSAPALIGDRATLGSYGDGAALFSYIKRNMPADRPGTLSDQQTLQVTAYVLLENGIVKGDTALSQDTLTSIDLKA